MKYVTVKPGPRAGTLVIAEEGYHGETQVVTYNKYLKCRPFFVKEGTGEAVEEGYPGPVEILTASAYWQRQLVTVDPVTFEKVKSGHTGPTITVPYSTYQKSQLVVVKAGTRTIAEKGYLGPTTTMTAAAYWQSRPVTVDPETLEEVGPEHPGPTMTLTYTNLQNKKTAKKKKLEKQFKACKALGEIEKNLSQSIQIPPQLSPLLKKNDAIIPLAYTSNKKTPFKIIHASEMLEEVIPKLEHNEAREEPENVYLQLLEQLFKIRADWKKVLVDPQYLETAPSRLLEKEVKNDTSILPNGLFNNYSSELKKGGFLGIYSAEQTSIKVLLMTYLETTKEKKLDLFTQLEWVEGAIEQLLGCTHYLVGATPGSEWDKDHRTAYQNYQNALQEYEKKPLLSNTRANHLLDNLAESKKKFRELLLAQPVYLPTQGMIHAARQFSKIPNLYAINHAPKYKINAVSFDPTLNKKKAFESLDDAYRGVLCFKKDMYYIDERLEVKLLKFVGDASSPVYQKLQNILGKKRSPQLLPGKLVQEFCEENDMGHHPSANVELSHQKLDIGKYCIVYHTIDTIPLNAELFLDYGQGFQMWLHKKKSTSKEISKEAMKVMLPQHCPLVHYLSEYNWIQKPGQKKEDAIIIKGEETYSPLQQGEQPQDSPSTFEKTNILTSREVDECFNQYYKNNIPSSGDDCLSIFRYFNQHDKNNTPSPSDGYLSISHCFNQKTHNDIHSSSRQNNIVEESPTRSEGNKNINHCFFPEDNIPSMNIVRKREDSSDKEYLKRKKIFFKQSNSKGVTYRNKIPLDFQKTHVDIEIKKNGNCMYSAYAVALILYLRDRSLGNSFIAGFICGKLKINQADTVRFYELLNQKSITETDILDIQDRFSRPLRALAASAVYEEFQNDPSSSSLFVDTGYFFRKELVPDIEENKNLSLAEISRMPNFQENIKEFLSSYSDIINEHNINALVQEFFTINNSQNLADYCNYLNIDGIWGSQETLFCLHRTIKGETKIRDNHNNVEIRELFPLPLKLFVNGIPGDAVCPTENAVILNNVDENHWEVIAMKNQDTISYEFRTFNKMN